MLTILAIAEILVRRAALSLFSAHCRLVAQQVAAFQLSLLVGNDWPLS